ncbi:MAG: hypothetical protein KA524_10540 [Nitrosomonas sp.]|nr:hypothetical protein [Nitrosomonas sp.]MBP6076838.1 hypothetical protein [Nitrosomonas sp.]
MTLQLNQPLQRTLVGQKSWWVLDDGLEIVAFDYQTPSWNRPRRVVDIRQKIDESPDMLKANNFLYS